MPHDVYCHYANGNFSTLEVEAMTGVSPVLQRTWKQRGFLSRRKTARASFSAPEVVEIMALQIASQSVPVEMKFVQEAVAAAVPAVLWFALTYDKAWDVEGTPEQKAVFRRALASDNKGGLPLLDKVLDLRGEHVGRYVLLRPDCWEFVNKLDGAFEDENSPVGIVLDLFAVAKKLVNSPKRPRGLMVATNIETSSRRFAIPFPDRKRDGK
jgi:hypothetical protein